MPFSHHRRKTDVQPEQASPASTTKWPSSLNRFENQLLKFAQAWARPAGNAWLLHDDGSIVEFPNSVVHEATDSLEAAAYTHTRVPLVGQWSIVVGGVGQQDMERFDNAVQMLARLARQQGELQATASVAMENSDEVSALQQLVSIPIQTLERPTLLSYLAQITLTTARSAAALVIDEHGVQSASGKSSAVETLADTLSAHPSKTVVRAGDGAATFDCVGKKILDGKALLAIAGSPGVSITATQLRLFDYAANHADGLLRLSASEHVISH